MASSTHSQFLDLTNGEGGERHQHQHPGESDMELAVDPAAEAASSLPHHHHHQVLNQHLLHPEETGEYEEEGEGEDYQYGDDDEDDRRIGVAMLLADYEGGEEGYGDGEGDVGDDGGGEDHIDDHFPHHPRPVGGRGRLRGMNASTPGKVVETGREHTGRWTKEEHEAFLSALELYGKEWKKVAARVKTRTVVQTRTHAQKYFQKLQKTVEATGGADEISQVEMGSGGHSGRKKNRRSSSTTINAAQVISALSHGRDSSAHQQARSTAAAPLPPLSIDKSSAAYTNTSLSVSFAASGSSHGGHLLGPPPALPSVARHGFSSPSAASTGSSGAAITSSRGVASSSIKITAPDPTLMLKTVGFPEPSPAATGKRKLAEIAAARMLAGVAGGQHSAGGGAGASCFSISDDGPPTPPPPDFGPSLSIAGGASGMIDLKEAPPLPPLASALEVKGFGGGGGGNRKGLSLQIVNPDSLGVTYDRKRSSGDSPVTPWDGQLEALVTSITTAESDTGISFGTFESSGGVPGISGDSVHSIVQPADGYKRAALHMAVCENNLDFVRTILDQQQANGAAQEDLEQFLCQTDDLGFAPLHSACALLLLQDSSESATALDMVTTLLQAGADISQKDRRENTPLHWAARAGDNPVVDKLLLRANADARNVDRETPLHWAMRAGKRSRAVVATLMDSGGRPNVFNKDFRRPIDVAAEGFLDDPNSLASLKASAEAGKKVKKDLNRVQRESKIDCRESRSNLLIRSPHSRTLVLHHPECLEHHPKSSTDWETPDRVKSIMRRVVPHSDATGTTETSGVFPHEITVSQEFDRAKLDLLRRVHSTEYLSFVNQLSKDLEKQLKENGSSLEEDSSFASPPPVVPFTPMVQRSMIKIDEANVKCGISSDTSFSAGSLKAARRAAGAVQHAVDCVLVGRNRNAFCVVRPPGHHAGINGLLEGGESCGFCIFNNVAAGALYAISDDRLLCNRCAIVDIDVHHGNGTEEIVRKCQDPSKLFFFSIHLYDNDKRKRNGSQYYKFYPGTGDDDDLALNIINVPIVPLWKETAPAPGTMASRTHNTRQKTRSSQEDESETETPREESRASDGGSDVASTTATSVTSPLHAAAAAATSSGRMAYRQAIQSRLLPALRAFNPDLILISAGFDAAKGDVGNARHERGREKMGLDLEPEDYAWTTRKILEIADICCHGRVVSVLEGGYGRTPAAPPVNPGQGNTLDRTVFAECAIRHLQAMIDPYDTEKRFS